MKKRRGRKAVVIDLDATERETLERWARRPSTPQGLAMRCRVVLGAAQDRANVDIATELGCSTNTVSKWRNRFAQRRLDGLYDDPRPGPPRLIDDAKVEEVVVKTLEETPADATHWSTRSMARAVGLSQSSILRIWRAFGLKPHRTEDFKISPDPQFVEKGLIDAPMVVKSMMGRFGGCAASSGIGWRGGGCGLGRVRVLRCDWGGFRRLGRSG